MCHISTQQIAADGLDVANALTDIANQPGISTQVKADLLSAADGVVKVTSNWTTGSSKALFDDAMKVVTTVLSEIPLTAPYAIFVAIAQTAIDLLWSNIDNVGGSGTTVSPSSVKAVLARHAANVEAAPSPWHDRVKLEHRFLESYRDSVKRTWNDQVNLQPALGIKKL